MSKETTLDELQHQFTKFQEAMKMHFSIIA